MDKMKFETPDMTERNIDKIAELFPNCVTEMKDEKGKIKRGVNFEMLKQMLSPDVVEGGECYEFTWVGKKASIVEANRPIRKTLRPCPESSRRTDPSAKRCVHARRKARTGIQRKISISKAIILKYSNFCKKATSAR